MPSNLNMIKLNQKMPMQLGYGNSNNYNNNRVYNNINNNLYNQNNINIINNNLDYSNPNPRTNLNTNNITNNPQDKIILMSNNNNNINNINNNTRIKCTCSKTGCKKKYCYCFSKGIFCDGCECKNCENCRPGVSNQLNIQNSENNEKKIINEEFNNIQEEVQSPKNQRVICNCTKSYCMKKYCECFKQGFNCNSLCRCLDCKNKIYINNMDDFTENKISLQNANTQYNLNSNIKNNNNNYIKDDLINSNNFYNYALHNNINNNIINNNIINTGSYIPETFGKSVDYSNPINFQCEAFGIYLKNEKIKIDPRKINLYENKKEQKDNNIIINNNNDINLGEINETPKFTNKKRLREKSDNSTNVKTCPTTNSSNKIKKAVPVVNKNIKRKKLQLN